MAPTKKNPKAAEPTPAEVSPGKDPEPKEPEVKATNVQTTENPDDSRSAYTENFVAQIAAPAGIDLLSVRPVGWVGPAPFSTSRDKIGELIEILKALK